MIPRWMTDIRPDDLQNQTLQELVELIGMDGMLRLVESYSGMVIYVPKLDSVIKMVRDRHIREEFDGTNSRKLALRYDVSESWVYRVVNEKQLHGQINMFNGIDNAI